MAGTPSPRVSGWTETLEVSECNSLANPSFFHLLLTIFLVPGDSGAWVFEKSTGRVCGAVLAWSDKTRTAYIAPMEVLLDDIARTLQATRVTLPGSPDESLAYAMPHSPIPQNPRYRAPLPLPDQLPVDLNRQLRLDDPSVGAVNTSRGLRDPYRNLPPILTPGPGRSLERQLA
jgi:hypothetical protein